MIIQRLINIFQKKKFQLVLLCLIVVISYFNILQNDISYDDQDFFVKWPAVRDSASGLSAFLSLPDLLAGNIPAGHRGVYRPIRSIYYLLSLKVWGFNPPAFHLQAIVVHLLITITIYFIVGLLIRNSQPKAKILPFLTAALFAAHPIHTEAVSYTAASMDTLGILFFFASYYFYLKAESTKSERGSSRLLSWMLAFLSFFTYEMTLVLPLLIILYEICFKKLNRKNLLNRFYIYLPYFLLIAAYLTVRFALLKIGDRSSYLGGTYLPASNQAKFGIFEILITYIRLLIFPLKLTVTYPLPDYLFSAFYKSIVVMNPSGDLLEKIGKVVIIIPPLVIGSIVLFIIKTLSNKLIAFALGWFFLSQILILNILPQGAVMAERFLYIPSFGFCLLLGLGIYKISTTRFIKTPSNINLLAGASIFTLVVCLYTTRTIARNWDWKDQESIFKSALKLDTKEVRANAALGQINLDKKDYNEAIRYLEAAIESTDDSTVHQQLGFAYENNNQLDKAYTEYRKTLDLAPNSYFSNIGLGNIYKKQGKLDEAIDEYKKVISSQPDNIDAHFNLAGIYTEKKMYDEALDEYKKVLKLNPQTGAAHSNIAYIYELMGELGKAITEYQKAIEIEPNNFHFHDNLGAAYEKEGNKHAALAEYKQALTLQPEEKSLKDKVRQLE